MQALSPYLVQNEICAILVYSCSVGNSGGIFEFNHPVYLTVRAKNSWISCKKFKICAILAYFCQNLVAMATPLTLLQIPVAHLNLPSP